MSFKQRVFSLLSWNRFFRLSSWSNILHLSSWSHVVAIGSIAILFAACDDDSGSSVDPENEAELAEISSSSKETSSSSIEKSKSSSSVDKVSSSSSKRTASSSSVAQGDAKQSSSSKAAVKSSSSIGTSSSSIVKPQSSSSEAISPSSGSFGEKSSSSETVVKSSNSVSGVSSSSLVISDGWSWDVPKDARLNPEITYGTMTDSRDGKTYKTVKIGNQTWMAENLNYDDSVTTESLIDESWCYNDVAANCDVAGRLYSWRAAIDIEKTSCGNGSICLTTLPVQGICPEGWHLPDSTEWNTLFAAVGGASTAGKMLRSQGGWNGDYDGSIVKGIDAYGFSALPAGHRYSNGFFSDEGRCARFWSASEEDYSNAYYVSLITSNEYVALDSYVKSKGHSVRCLKD